MLRRLLRPVVVVHAVALAVLLVAYFGNTDMGGDATSPRGDGKYRPILARGDGHLMWLQVRSLVLDGDLDYANDMRQFNPIWPPARTRAGRPGIVHPIGPALVWAGPFVLAHSAAVLANLAGADIPDHGYTLWHQRVVFTTSPLFSLGAVLLGWWMARRSGIGRWGPLHASMAILFGTSITTFATFQPGTAHPMDALATAGFLAVWVATIGDLRRRRWALLGALVGLCALIRITGFVLLAAPGLELLSRLRRERLRSLVESAALLGGVAALTFLPQVVAWKVVYGAWLTSPMGQGFMQLGHPQIAQLLFSSRNGWFSTTPLAYAGATGLLLLLRDPRTRLVAAGLLVVVALQVYTNACVFDWWAGTSHGARRLVGLTAVLVVGLAAWMRLLGRLARRVPAAVLHAVAVVGLGWLVAWNVVAVSRLRGGRNASAEVRRSCCAELPRAMAAVAQPVYDLLGNPFQLPMSAWFALRHGVEVGRWDLVGGAYLLEHDWYEYKGGAYRQSVTAWKLASRNVAPLILDGIKVERGVATTTARAVDFYAPLHLPLAHRFTVALWSPTAPQPVSFAVNGKVFATQEIGGARTDVTFDVPAEDLGVGGNVLRIEGREPGLVVLMVTVGYPP